jgi:hypothetical protein
MVDYRLDDLSRVDGRPIERSAEEIFGCDESVSRVEMQEAEHFVVPAAQVQSQKFLRASRFR